MPGLETFKSTPQKDYLPPAPDTSDLFLKGLIKLKAQLIENEAELKNTADDQKTMILKIEIEALKKRIKSYEESLNRHSKIEKNQDLIKTAGKNNVIEIKNFRKRPKNDEQDSESQVGDDFLNSLKEFKDNKRKAQLH